MELLQSWMHQQVIKRIITGFLVVPMIFINCYTYKIKGVFKWECRYSFTLIKFLLYSITFEKFSILHDSHRNLKTLLKWHFWKISSLTKTWKFQICCFVLSISIFETKIFKEYLVKFSYINLLFLICWVF